MREVIYTTKFKKDYKAARKTPRFKKWASTFEDCIQKLCAGEKLPSTPPISDKPTAKHSEQEYQGCREFHAAPDIVVIYRMTAGELQLVRVGQHNNLGLTENIK